MCSNINLVMSNNDLVCVLTAHPRIESCAAATKCDVHFGAVLLM